MKEFFERLFSSDFMAHGYCYLWKPEIVWLHAISDASDRLVLLCNSGGAGLFCPQAARPALPLDVLYVWRIYSRLRLDPSHGNLDAVAWHLPAGRA